MFLHHHKTQKVCYNGARQELYTEPIDVKIDDVLGLKTLYKGRTSDVRKRMHYFIMEVCKGLVMAYVNRTSYKFMWENFAFNQPQRQAILRFLEVNDFIEGYSKGFSFGEDVFKQTELHPSRKIFDSITLVQTPDTKTVIRCNKSATSKNDNDSKFLAKYSRRLETSLNVPLIDFKRIYSNSVDLGGRIYSAYQGMSAIDRTELIKINGSSVVELDYRNNHLNILLTSFGRPLDRDTDLYSIMDDYYLDRKHVKMAISAVLNAARPLQALTSEYGSFAWESNLANEFLNRFNMHFPELKNIRHGSEFGLTLQKLEGDIMLDIMKQVYDRGTIVLPVHDSLICKETDKHAVHELMASVWEESVTNNKNKFIGFLK